MREARAAVEHDAVRRRWPGVPTARGGVLTVADTSGVVEWTAVLLSEGRAAVFSAAGELLHGDPDAGEKHLVYLVEREGRCDVLAPSAFWERFPGARRLGGPTNPAAQP